MEDKLYSENDLREALFLALYTEKKECCITKTIDSIVREVIQSLNKKK